MKTKILILAGAFTFTAAIAQAQYTNYKNTIKVGARAGAAIPSGNAAASAGVNVAYQNLVTPHFGLGIATGYDHYFGKENEIGGTTLNNNSFGVVPVAALLRYYPKNEGIYIGTDIGYGVITGDEKVATNSNVNRPNGGFYLKPEIGYHNRNWNIFAQYGKVFTGEEGKINVGNATQKYNAGTIGVGLTYNIGIGADR